MNRNFSLDLSLNFETSRFACQCSYHISCPTVFYENKMMRCLFPQGLSPTEIIEGYELACKKTLEILPGKKTSLVSSQHCLGSSIPSLVMQHGVQNPLCFQSQLTRLCFVVSPHRSVLLVVEGSPGRDGGGESHPHSSHEQTVRQ